MITYIDTSALVKRYVAEEGSADVGELVGQSTAVGTAIISRTEVAAALAKAVRMKLLSRKEAISALQVFNSEWRNLIRLQITEILVSRAAVLAWDIGLRGYDAIHLTSALYWQDMIGESVIMATYDQNLWGASKAVDLLVWPESLR